MTWPLGGSVPAVAVRAGYGDFLALPYTLAQPAFGVPPGAPIERMSRRDPADEELQKKGRPIRAAPQMIRNG